MSHLDPGTAQWCVTIEGIPYVLTDGAPAAAAAAYPSYPDAYDGLFVKMQAVTELHPWDAFRSGGSCELWILPDSARADRVGIDTRRRNAGAQTVLTASSDRVDTSIKVKRSDDFPAAPFDAFYIGNECLGASAKPDTNTITAGARGKYAPFTIDGGTTPHFAQHHRYGNYDYSIALEPEVTLYPRTWNRRWVAVRRHSKTLGVLNTGEGATPAECLFAGVIDGGPEHDPDTLCTKFKLKHVIDHIKETTIGREMWSGKATEGFKLVAGDTFGWKDQVGTTIKTANVLLVKVGAAGANEIEEGYYTAEQLAHYVNVWLASEKAATRLDGTYTCEVVPTDAGWRFRITYRIGASGNNVSFEANMRARYAALLGLSEEGLTAGDEWNGGNTHPSGGGIDHVYVGVRPPKRVALGGSGQTSNAVTGADFDLPIEDSRGVLNDQKVYMPQVAGGPGVDENDWPEGNPAGLFWGLFLVDDRILVRAAWSGSSPTTLKHVMTIDALGGEVFEGAALFSTYGHDYGDDSGPMLIKQVLYLEGAFGELLKALFYSTGTTGYNHATHDGFGYGIGLAIPGALLGATFEQSIDDLPAAEAGALWIIKEGTTVEQLLNVDCVIRRAHLIFTAGHLKFISWKTPTTGLATVAFDDTNKAEPVGNGITQRTHTIDDGQHASPIVKLDYNRLLRTGEYRGHIFIGDLTAIDNAGGAAPARTLAAQNLYAEIDGTAAAIEEVVPELVKWHPMISQPFQVANRSISPNLYGAVAAGDIGVLTDEGVGDPLTGQLGVTSLPVLVMRTTYDYGGAEPGVGAERGSASSSVRPAVGSVRIAWFDVNRFTEYVPCAQFNGGDYNAGTKTITCQAHEHSEAADAADASRFANGYAIRVVEVDPPVPATPLTYLRNVSGTPVGNSIVHDGVALGTGGGETAFDTTKKYRVIFQGYTASTALQQAKCYQADDADGLIANLVQAYRYGSAPSGAYTKSHHYDLGEKLPTVAYGDGVPLDVGHERGLARLCNNVYDHKTAKQFPMLIMGTPRVAAPASGYELLFLTEVDLGMVVLSAQVRRFLYVSPWFSSSDGTSVTCRVSLCRFQPTGSAARTMDTPFPGTVSSALFTTSSTTWSNPTSKGLDLAIGVQRTTGKAWLAIEGTAKCQSRGLAESIVREREVAGF